MCYFKLRLIFLGKNPRIYFLIEYRPSSFSNNFHIIIGTAFLVGRYSGGSHRRRAAATEHTLILSSPLCLNQKQINKQNKILWGFSSVPHPVCVCD